MEYIAIVAGGLLFTVGFTSLVVAVVKTEQAKAQAEQSKAQSAVRMADSYEIAMSEYRDSLDRQNPWGWQDPMGGE